MSGRVAAVSGRATFDLIRERLGPRVGMLNLLSSMLITLLTYTAEIGGGAPARRPGASVHELLVLPGPGRLLVVVLRGGPLSQIQTEFGRLRLGGGLFP